MNIDQLTNSNIVNMEHDSETAARKIYVESEIENLKKQFKEFEGMQKHCDCEGKIESLTKKFEKFKAKSHTDNDAETEAKKVRKENYCVLDIDENFHERLLSKISGDEEWVYENGEWLQVAGTSSDLDDSSNQNDNITLATLHWENETIAGDGKFLNFLLYFENFRPTRIRT